MNIEIIKYDLLNKLMNTTDKELLAQLVSVFNKAENKIEPISVEQYNQELEAAETRIMRGNFISHDDLEHESEGW